jgi:hypothetical protein
MEREMIRRAAWFSMVCVAAVATNGCGSKDSTGASASSATAKSGTPASSGASASAPGKPATSNTKFPLPAGVDKVAHPARYAVLVPVPKGSKPVLKDHAGTWAWIKDWTVSMSDNSANCGEIAKVKEAIVGAKLLLDEPDQLIWDKDGKIGFYARKKLPDDAGIVCCIGKELAGKDGFGGDLADIAVQDQSVASRADAERGIAVCQNFDWKP